MIYGNRFNGDVVISLLHSAAAIASKRASFQWARTPEISRAIKVDAERGAFGIARSATNAHCSDNC